MSSPLCSIIGHNFNSIKTEFKSVMWFRWNSQLFLKDILAINHLVQFSNERIIISKSLKISRFTTSLDELEK